MWACEIHGLYSWLDQPRRAVNSPNFGHVWKSFAGPDEYFFRYWIIFGASGGADETESCDRCLTPQS